MNYFESFAFFIDDIFADVLAVVHFQKFGLLFKQLHCDCVLHLLYIIINYPVKNHMGQVKVFILYVLGKAFQT